VELNPNNLDKYEATLFIDAGSTNCNIERNIINNKPSDSKVTYFISFGSSSLTGLKQIQLIFSKTL
jgi:hypothetical protein